MTSGPHPLVRAMEEKEKEGAGRYWAILGRKKEKKRNRPRAKVESGRWEKKRGGRRPS